MPMLGPVHHIRSSGTTRRIADLPLSGQLPVQRVIDNRVRLDAKAPCEKIGTQEHGLQ